MAAAEGPPLVNLQPTRIGAPRKYSGTPAENFDDWSLQVRGYMSLQNRQYSGLMERAARLQHPYGLLDYFTTAEAEHLAGLQDDQERAALQ